MHAVKVALAARQIASGNLDLSQRAEQQVVTRRHQINHSINRVAGVETTTREQTDGSAQVGIAVNQMDRATQQNAALVEQSAAAAEGLNQQAQALMADVSRSRPQAA